MLVRSFIFNDKLVKRSSKKKAQERTIASSFVNKMQREDTILLKTSDGSIDVS